MRFSIDHLASGAEAHLGAPFAHALLRSASSLDGPLGALQIGSLIADALDLTQAKGVAGALPLTTFDVIQGADSWTHLPATMELHPGLSPWVGTTFGEMIGRIITSDQVAAENPHASAPGYGCLELITAGQVQAASVVLMFPATPTFATVICHYGPNTLLAPYARVVRLNANTLSNIAATAREDERQPRGLPVITAAPQSATIH